MIELKNLTKKYDNIVLDDVNLKLEEGKIYVIKGISGSGKTTILNILSLLDFDYSGKYLWNNKEVKKMPRKKTEEIRNQISYVFQKSYLFNELTIRENLMFINSNQKLIDEYASVFNIRHLLDKKSDEVSGGERQRASLVRSLLLDSKLIVLDEPTSSLDKENSELLKKYLEKMISKDKIIIISTHKEIYDDIADVIYSIDYGKLKIDKNNEIIKNYHSNEKIEIKHHKKDDILFVKKRKKKKIMLVIMFVLFFLSIFALISILQNFKREVIRSSLNSYPLHVLNIRKNDLYTSTFNIKKIYQNYKIIRDNFNAYILLDNNDSYFNYADGLKCGFFPKSDDEVLVNAEFIKENYSIDNCKDIIGTSIMLSGENFTISGVIRSKEALYFGNNFYSSIISYNDTNTKIKPSVFVPYEKMKKIGIIYDDSEAIATISNEDAVNLYLHQKGINDMTLILPWYTTVNNEISSVYFYTSFIFLILILAMIFIFIFLVSKISLELFYRKKEIGFIKLYNVSNKRIKFIYMLDFFYEIIISFIISLFIFHLLCFIIYIKSRMLYFISPLYLVLIMLVTYIYFYALISIPLSKYLKKDILKCINN